MSFLFRRRTFIAGALAGSLQGLPGTALAETAALRIGTAGQDGNSSECYALDGGFFKKYGLDNVDIQLIRRGSGAAIIAAMTGGALDIAESDLMAIAAAKEHGIALSILWPSAISVNEHPTSAIIVGKNSAFRSAKDLVGKNIGVPSLEGPNRLSTNAWLGQNGVTPSLVKFVEIPMSSMAAAVDRGTVDAAVTTEPNVTAALQSGTIRVFAHPWDAIAKRWVITAYVATDDWVKKNPDQATAFVKAIRDAQVWANRNHDKTAVIFQKWSSMPMETIQTMTRSTYTEKLDLALIQPLLDVGYKEKILPQPITAKDLVNAVALTR